MSTTTPAVTPASIARDALAASLARAKDAGLASLRKAYGADADLASVTLAHRAARVLAGESSPRGGAGDRINKLVKFAREATHATPAAPAKELTAAMLADAARAILDAHKAAEKARRDGLKADRQAAKDKLNDRGAPVGERRAAFELMTAIDGDAARERDAARENRLRSALTSARDAKISAETVAAIFAEVFALDAYANDGAITLLPAGTVVVADAA